MDSFYPCVLVSPNARITVHIEKSVFKQGYCNVCHSLFLVSLLLLSFCGIGNGSEPCHHVCVNNSRPCQAFALLSSVYSTGCASSMVEREVGQWGLFSLHVPYHRFVWHVLYHGGSYAEVRFNSLHISHWD